MNKIQPSSITCETGLPDEQADVTPQALAHRLGGPLRLIAGFSELVLNEHSSRLTPEAAYLMRQITQTAFDIERTTRELSQAAYLRTRPVYLSKVDMNKLVARVMEDLRAEDPFCRAQFKIEELPPCTADARLLARVLLNLVRNAVKFSRHEKDPVIEIGFSYSDDRLNFHVRDNGIGFGMRDAGHLFEPFERLHGREGYEGCGLGLFIAKTLVEKQGGRLWAEAAVNQGATFHIDLPCEGRPEVGSIKPKSTKTVETESHVV